MSFDNTFGTVKSKKKKLYDKWVKCTESEENRRDGVEMQWKNNRKHDTVTELTTPTTRKAGEKTSSSTTKSNLSKNISDVSNYITPLLSVKEKATQVVDLSHNTFIHKHQQHKQ